MQRRCLFSDGKAVPIKTQEAGGFAIENIALLLERKEVGLFNRIKGRFDDLVPSQTLEQTLKLHRTAGRCEKPDKVMADKDVFSGRHCAALSKGVAAKI